jgi:hypothetical protein
MICIHERPECPSTRGARVRRWGAGAGRPLFVSYDAASTHLAPHLSGRLAPVPVLSPPFPPLAVVAAGRREKIINNRHWEIFLMTKLLVRSSLWRLSGDRHQPVGRPVSQPADRLMIPLCKLNAQPIRAELRPAASVTRAPASASACVASQASLSSRLPYGPFFAWRPRRHSARAKKTTRRQPLSLCARVVAPESPDWQCRPGGFSASPSFHRPLSHRPPPVGNTTAKRGLVARRSPINHLTGSSRAPSDLGSPPPTIIH